ncbi:MAG TPA: N-acetylmuramoyl-L-alanine amidase [Candidatus Nanopelagicales bacterium]|nr:N-acetylmuramoyl-L-alanine amidase [Candidatus Nanopelagicales bacterium]
MLRLGASGAAVAEIRARLAHLGLCADAPPGADPESLTFDDELDRAVREFQQERGITVDGIVGPNTFRRLDEARWQLGDRVLSYVPGHMMIGDDVTQLQRRLTELGFNPGRTDGIFGPDTDTALREFQAGVGVVSDGTCGPETFRAFDRLIRTVIGGDAAELREHVQLSDLQSGVADKVIVIDPGSTVEPDICHAIAVRVEGRLAALGTQALLTRPAHGQHPSEAERADFANTVGADITVSIHIDRSTSAAPHGIATFYYGHPRGSLHSHAGKFLAEHVQRELLARTDRLDCRIHPRTWDLLRLTRMPAVRIEVGYISNPDDARNLTSEAFQDALAEGIAHAITAVCAPVGQRA